MHFPMMLLLLAAFWSATCEKWEIKKKRVNARVDRLHRTRRSTFVHEWILLDAQRQEFIDAHNFYRRKVQPQAANMRDIEWDKGLEKLATDYSKKCDYNHRPAEERKTSNFTKVGENLARWGSFSVNKTMEAWYIEKEDYNFESATCNQGKVCGHYTQLVWWESYKIGCGVSLCEKLIKGLPRGYLFVCNYGPAGNIRYANRNSLPVKPYKKGEPASACDSAFPRNNDGLCSKSAGHAIISASSSTKATQPPDTTTTLQPILAGNSAQENDQNINFSLENSRNVFGNPADEDSEDNSKQVNSVDGQKFTANPADGGSQAIKWRWWPGPHFIKSENYFDVFDCNCNIFFLFVRVRQTIAT